MSNWLRPDAATSPDRLFCHCYARGRGNAQMIPGWPYSVIAALEPGRTSWTLPLDAVRLGPADDATAVTAAQVREVATRIIAAGHWRDGDPDILVVFDAGYDLTRLAWLLRDLPAEVTGRLRSDRVMYFPAPPRAARHQRPPAAARGRVQARRPERPGPPRRRPPSPRRPGTAPPGPRPGAGCTSSWPPAPDGKTTMASCPSSRAPSSGCTSITCPATAAPSRCGCGPHAPGTCADEVDRAWQAFLRRFDIEHMFRFFKQVLGWTRPKLRDPAAADRWTWIILACYAQLRLARHLAADLRLPWQRPCPPGRLTPARVRRGFRNIRQTLPALASAPKPGKPGPGRPPGSKNRRPATRHDVGKTVKRDEPKKKTRRQKG